ncbi:NAD(P)H-quinone oxidoreductase [Sphingopyxis terrae]|uniref:Putative NAD(P)H quinone oxidoreductase, PIG3 family n=1 Tax=Sphingopyxis terrae subsp. ummariensis TaxID=429001 RepID=A0A1Y6FUG0_9SPHN|nr:NAD(P)H-quinone oxidoreductase [Sphingopyxis terrae]PCF91584.1 NAD(P)H-quinone oxidoreductase [Sphingopyxis terrae subsp. ummariensis]SMQ76800.1 putative NAD(P)H quinone oxidoreductase, PIG3 family [Sphingopyxis terrae subsp. ummariensis]
MTSLPESMTAVAIREPGGPEVLVAEQRPVPRPGPGELLIRVAAAGVNRPDVLQRMGFYPPPPGASDLPGLEIAGTVAATGPGGDPEMLGQAVCALVAGGGYAEYCVAPTGSVLPVPAGFTMAEAAALPETIFTVWHNLFERGWIKEGETALVHGGTSGIGTTAIGLCKLFDIRIIVTCGSAEKCDAARALGADLAIDYSAEDYVEAVKAFTDGAGVDVVLDMVGGDYVPRNLACLADDGRHVTIAFQRGAKAEIDMSQLMRRRLTMTGSTLRARSADFKAALADEIHKTLWPRLSSGAWKPAMDQAFPLADAAAAHARMQAGAHVGKIVLTIG